MPLYVAAFTASKIAPTEVRGFFRYEKRLAPGLRVGLAYPSAVFSDHPIGGSVVVEKWERNRWVEAWRERGLNPWKLVLADVDGDGRPDVVVGAWKKSPFDRIMEKRVFIYDWNGERLMPKWLSSRLTRRFDDFACEKVLGDSCTRILALERGPKDTHRVSMYRWDGFGCDWICSSANFGGATRFQTNDKLVYVHFGSSLFSVQLSSDSVRLVKVRP